MATRSSYAVKLIYNLAIFCCYIGLLSSVEVDTDRCPKHLPRDKYLRVHGNKCYRFITNEVSWPSAHSTCRRSGGGLITITRRDIQIFVERTLHEIWRNNGMWIGAHDRDSEMDWYWVTGEKVRSGFQNWDSGQPSCFLPKFLCHEDCACLRKDKGYQWHDYLCSSSLYEYGFACQYDLLPLPKTTKRLTLKTTTTTPTTTTTTTTTTTPPTTTTTTTSTTTPITTVLQTKKTLRIKTTSEEKLTTEKVTAKITTDLETSTGTVVSEKNIQSNLSTKTTKGKTKKAVSRGRWSLFTGNINVQSQRLYKGEESSMATGGMVGLVISFLLVFILGLIIGIFICKRRYKKRYAERERVDLGFNNVLYTATPSYATQRKVKDTNVMSIDDDCLTDEEVDHRYTDIDEIAVGSRYVDMPECKELNGPVDVSCLKENMYDSVKTHVETRPGKDEGDVGGACGEDAPPPCPGRNLEKFAPEFLKKETNVSQAYSNNLYGYNK